jgi:hypothetical protein
MRQDVTVTTAVTSTPRILQAGAMFDVPPLERAARTWAVDLPIDERDWSVGLIVGPSGAGKSSVAAACFGVQPEPSWHQDRSVLDDFPAGMGVRSIVNALTAVGFGSPPAWMRPYATLSTGEQFRVNCARRLAEATEGSIVVIDEYTSVVDRQVAQVASHSLAKAVRRNGQKLVAVTCHYDVVDWLQPDWIYQPHVEDFAWRSVQPRPSVDVGIYPVDKTAWRVFSPHHYLSAAHSRSATAFGMFVGDECVAFHSYRHFVHPHMRNTKQGHRLVVLPDWQGLGLSLRFAEWMGQHLYEQGSRYRIVTAHPAVVRSLSRSPRWVNNNPSMRLRANVSSAPDLRRFQADTRRLNTHSFEYVPPKTLTAEG